MRNICPEISNCITDQKQLPWQSSTVLTYFARNWSTQFKDPEMPLRVFMQPELQDSSVIAKRQNAVDWAWGGTKATVHTAICKAMEALDMVKRTACP